MVLHDDERGRSRRNDRDRPPTGGPAVRIIVDPGAPASAVEKVHDRLDSRLREDAGVVSVTVDIEAVPLNPDGGLLEPDLTGGDDASLFVVVTEFPRMRDRRATTAEIDRRRGAVIVSLPALGLGSWNRLVPVIVDSIVRLRHPDATNRTRRTQWRPGEHTDTEYLSGPPGLSRIRVVAGMVRGNRPWRLIPTLTGLMAGAAATASFGVFYSSIWVMANVLSAWRLAGLSILSMVVMTVWLIVNNRLWERGELPAPRARLYNAATTTTVLLNAVVLYAGLFVATSCTAFAVIDSGYLSEQLGLAAASIGNYLDLAWLATSMGVVAGAVGSSADSYDDILNATYGSRERARRRREDNRERRREAAREKS